MANSSTWSDLGITLRRSHGQQRVDCPHCTGSSRKTVSVDADRGLYCCHRCGWSGRIGGNENWLEGQLERMRQADAERDRNRQSAARQAFTLWNTAATAMWHPYLKRKAVLPLGIRQRNDRLVIPMTDIDGGLWNCQTIDKQGAKRFLRGGRVKGCFYLIDGESQEIYLAEGFATAAAVHLYFRRKCRIAVAFNAGNIKPVAEALRLRNPSTRLVIAADNDQWTDGNPGLTKAREAAAAVNASIIWPKFDGLDTSGKPTDFCDLHLLQREARQ